MFTFELYPEFLPSLEALAFLEFLDVSTALVLFSLESFLFCLSSLDLSRLVLVLSLLWFLEFLNLNINS